MNFNNRKNNGREFETLDNARDKINRINNPEGNFVLMYFPTEVELINTINTYTNIKRLDIYFHAFAHGLNIERFRGKRDIEGVELDSK